MTATLLQATDEIFALFRAEWLANSPALNGGQAPAILWQGRAYPTLPKLPYVLAHIVDGGPPIQYLVDSESRQLIRRKGFVTIQIRVPIGEGDAFGLQLATVARDAFERRDTPSGVFFFDCQIHRHTESPGSPHAQFTVTAHFSFCEIK